MSVLQLNIPKDLENELSKFKTDVESVVINAIRQYIFYKKTEASEQDIENAGLIDNSEEFLTKTELNYYLSL